MKTAIYNIWTEQVEQFVKGNCVGTEMFRNLDCWLDEEGAKAFQIGQAKFFQPADWAIYSGATNPYIPELFDLTKQQIIAGFSAWFEALVAKFPALNTSKVIGEFSAFLLACTGEKYSTAIVLRTEITRKFVNRGDMKDIQSVMRDYGFAQQACEAAIRSMEQYVQKQKTVASVPRGPRSPAFHKETDTPLADVAGPGSHPASLPLS